MSTKLPTIWVVKLGGSLYEGRSLGDWLEAFAAHGGGKVVVVPGGGPFADQVRAAQQRWRFDDATGHRMAMLGMAQYGLMLTGLRPDLMPTRDDAGIRDALASGRAAVWIPTELDTMALPRDWSVTSDSLAVELASRLRATDLLLIKSAALASSRISATKLARRGVVDKAFPQLLVRAGCSCRILQAADPASFLKALNGAGDRGTIVTSA